MEELTKLRLMYVLSPVIFVTIVAFGAILDINDKIVTKLRKYSK